MTLVMLLNLRKGLVILLGLLCFWGVQAFADESLIELPTAKPKLILLTEYSDEQDVIGWLMSEKLDGVRAYWNGRQLVSRNGHVFAAPKFFTEGFPPFELDGELWIGRQKFQEAMSVVRKKVPHDGWRSVTYHVFEVPNQQGGLLERLAVLESYLADFKHDYIKIIPQTTISDRSVVQKRLKLVLDQGGEGLVLRDGSALYHSGRSSQALKVKLKQDAECRVIGYTKGKGKYRDMVGALKCQLQAGQFLKIKQQAKRTIKIGSGLSDRLRTNPPKIGSLITFQYMGLTGSGLPRFPVFLRVKQSETFQKVSVGLSLED